MKSSMILFLLSVLPCVALGQGSSLNNPDVDNQIGVMQSVPRGMPSVLGVITSSEGYDNFDLGVDFAEPHASVNPLNQLEYFAAYNTNGTHHTEDGHDWAINNPPFPAPAGDPVTAYDNLGNLYYMTMRLNGGSIVGTWVIKSTDNGATWGAPVASVAGYDKCWMAADQTDGPFAGYVYGVMTPGNFSRTTNGGASWTQTWTTATQTLPGMMVAVGPNGVTNGGSVYVVTNSGSVTASTYTFYRSTDGGATFSQRSAQNWAGYIGTFVGGRHSVENSRTRPYPFIAADNSNGAFRDRLYCVYASNDPPGNGNKPDIWCRYSTNQGTTWSGPVRINDDLNTTQNHQWTPAIWCDLTTGRLYAKWYDTRECAPGDDSTDVFASYSDDGGVTWAQNQKLTTRKFKIDCATCGGGGIPRYQGDYDAITSTGESAMAVWTDFRNGTFMSTTAYFPDFAMQLSQYSAAGGTTGSVSLDAIVPGVKLYENTVTFSATVEPPANFTFSYPNGNVLNSFPGSIELDISWSGVAEGDYVVTIQGEGPGGTPVHRRSVDINVSGIAGVPCEEIDFFNAKCNANGVAQGMVKLLNSTAYVGETVEFQLDDTVYPVVLIANGPHTIGRLRVPGAGAGAHTVALINPADCYDPIVINCQIDGKPTGAEVAELGAESEDLNLESWDVPQESALLENYPNPFNPTTTLRYVLSGPGHVNLTVYNILGQPVRTIIDAYQDQGHHEVFWDGRNDQGIGVASGTYVYRIVAGDFVQTRRMLLMK